MILANFLTSINDDGNGLEAKSSITGKRGKCVRFADECGFSLETVRMVVSVLPNLSYARRNHNVWEKKYLIIHVIRSKWWGEIGHHLAVTVICR